MTVVVAWIVFAPNLASEPGQPLDCSDWVFLEPGLTCRIVDLCGPTIPLEVCYNLPERSADNAGGILEVRQVPFGAPACPGGGGNPNGRIQIARLHDGLATAVAYVQDRCGTPGSLDQVTMFNAQQGHAGFEPNYGRLYIGIQTRCTGSAPACQSGFIPWLFVIEGFTTTFEILQSFTPQPSALGFRVPYMPEGMAAVDHFDTYWGPLSRPIDFMQAHTLACDYPASQPQLGDYLTVADTVPTPTPGHGVYYVTAATYQGQTRYGRRTTAGQLSGRDPALLPACAP